MQLLQRAREEWGEGQGILTLRGGTKPSFASQFMFYVYIKNTRTTKFKFWKEASFYHKKVQLWLLMRKHSEHVAAAPFESNKVTLLHKLSFVFFAHVNGHVCLGPDRGYTATLPAHLWPAVLVQSIFLLAFPSDQVYKEPNKRPPNWSSICIHHDLGAWQNIVQNLKYHHWAMKLCHLSAELWWMPIAPYSQTFQTCSVLQTMKSFCSAQHRREGIAEGDP